MVVQRSCLRVLRPTVQTHAFDRLIGDSELAVGVNVTEWLCVRPVMSW